MFRVVPDQLRISQGWVRCGQCDEVFDATAYMQEAMAANESPEFAGSKDAVQPVAPASETVDIPLEALKNKPIRDVVSDSTELDSAYTTIHTQRSSDETIVSQAFMQELAMEEDPPQTEPKSEAQNLSFMKGSQAASPLHTPWVRAILYFSALLLGLGLILQVFVHERDRIAAVAPEVKPVLEALCDVMQCTVSPWRQIDSVVMDSSSFNKLRAEVYQLNFTLKNTAQMALAAPSIELSLKDAQDQPVFRRVIVPAELGFKSGSLAAVSESNSSLTLTIKTQGGLDRIAGYRVLAFYP